MYSFLLELEMVKNILLCNLNLVTIRDQLNVLVADRVLIKEGQAQLWSVLLHVLDVDETLVKVRVYFLQVIETVFLSHNCVQKGPRKLIPQSYVLVNGQTYIYRGRYRSVFRWIRNITFLLLRKVQPWWGEVTAHEIRSLWIVQKQDSGLTCTIKDKLLQYSVEELFLESSCIDSLFLHSQLIDESNLEIHSHVPFLHLVKSVNELVTSSYFYIIGMVILVIVIVVVIISCTVLIIFPFLP